MLVTYRLFGVFANVAVAINVAMIFGVLSLLNATLTLPGIAGIVLTVGIAVDSNVLIYERIREELRGGAMRFPQSTPVSGGRCRRSWIPTSPPSSPPRCCSISEPGRCAVCGDARHRHHHHGLHRVYPDPPDRSGVGALEAAADGADLGNATLTHSFSSRSAF